MRKGKSVIGKDVLSLEDGAKLEKVTDLILDPAGQRLVALVVDEGGLMSSARVVPIEEVSSFGKDAVVVRGHESIITTSQDPALKEIVDHDERILGKKVFTIEGDEQGSAADVYFDEATGAVLGYEVSGGLLGDVSKGTSYLATEEITTIGTDVIYIRPETAVVLEEQVGGVQGALRGAGDTLGAAGSAVTEKAGEARDAAGRGASSAGATSGDALVGRRTGSDVETDSGAVIVPRGRRVRPEDVEAARAAGKLPALTSSVALGTAQDAGEGAKDALGAAGDSAGNLWDQFTARIGEMTDATGRRVDEEQTKRRLSEIADAIGRPVTKVILDRDDNVILNLGDIITHQSIQRAHDAGGLDSLLSSVYKGTVEFSKHEMRAPEAVEAEATVDKATGGATVVAELEDKVRTAERERDETQERKKAESEREREQRKAERDSRRRERELESERRDEVGAVTD
ncbi:MAG TPA: PRC-barrel domain-containing protein [Clostridia bacterium]|nr:PRC-barrel domain-containing protein [Clostridia bacterium]